MGINSNYLNVVVYGDVEYGLGKNSKNSKFIIDGNGDSWIGSYSNNSFFVLMEIVVTGWEMNQKIPILKCKEM